MHTCSGQVKLRDGTVLDTALKCLPYSSAEDRALALNEVQALYEARGKPNVLQGLAVFEDHGTSPEDSVSLWVATK